MPFVRCRSRRSKYKAITKEKTNFGIIDAKTPIGRVFEFDIEQKKLDDDGLSERMTYIGVVEKAEPWHDSQIKLQHPDGELFQFSDESLPTISEWKEDYSAICTGYTDPVEAIEDEPGEPAEEPAGVDYKIVLETTCAMANKAARDLARWKASQKETAALKKITDASAAELIGYASDINLPLFDQGQDRADESEPVVEDWRECEVDYLEVPEKVRGALIKNEIQTVGDLVDFQAKHGTFWLKEMKGVGAAGGTQIDDALMKFWEAHPEACDRKEIDFNTIVNAKKTEALVAIQECDDAKLLADAEAAGLKGDWRRSAVAKRRDELATLNETEG